MKNGAEMANPPPNEAASEAAKQATKAAVVAAVKAAATEVAGEVATEIAPAPPPQSIAQHVVPRRAAPGRLQHIAGLIDDTTYIAILRKRLDELAGTVVQLRPALGASRNLAAVVEVQRRFDDEIGLALNACEACRPTDAGQHVEYAEGLGIQLDYFARAAQELSAVRTALDEMLRSADIAEYRNLPTLHGLYRAVDVVGRHLIVNGEPARALGVAETARHEIATLFDSRSNANHACRVCRRTGPSRLAEADAARLAALRDAGHPELAGRLACDLAARRPPRDVSRLHNLAERGGRVAAQARASAEALRLASSEPDTVSEENER